MGLMAIIVNGEFPLFETDDPYFQYMPIRMVAPVLSAWLTWRYLNHPSRMRYWLTMLALGAGPLWNLDTGLPAMASWIGVLAYGELGGEGTKRRKLGRIVNHLLAGGVCSLVAVLGYAIAVQVRSGRWPDFVAFLEFQRIFYGAGFFMLPMPAMGGWWAVAIVYLAGLAYAARSLNARSQIADFRFESGETRFEEIGGRGGTGRRWCSTWRRWGSGCSRIIRAGAIPACCRWCGGRRTC